MRIIRIELPMRFEVARALFVESVPKLKSVCAPNSAVAQIAIVLHRGYCT